MRERGAGLERNEKRERRKEDRDGASHGRKKDGDER